MGCHDYTPSPLDCKSLPVLEPWVICALPRVGCGVPRPGRPSVLTAQAVTNRHASQGPEDAWRAHSGLAQG